MSGETVPVERRRNGLSTTELRRQLRQADIQIYEQQIAIDALSAMTAERPGVTRRFVITLGAAAVVIGLGTGEIVHLRRQSMVTAVPAADSAAPLPLPPSPMLAMPLAAVPPPVAPAEDAVVAVAADATDPALGTAIGPTPRRAVKLERSAARPRRGAQPDLLQRLHLGWLRSKVSIRSDAIE